MKPLELYEFIEHSNWIEGVISQLAINDSLEAWNYLKDKQKIKIEDILEVHRLVMQNLNPKIAGKIRDCDVRVGCRPCPDIRRLGKLIANWIQEYGKGVKMAKEAKQAHIRFEHIHPFRDENGRTGRLIWLWHRERAGLPFEMIKEEDRFEYYKWF